MKKKSFKDILDNKVLIADGAMGTMLYEKGVFVNSCFEQLNLTQPELVQHIHAEYISAGADIIETNTFGANSFRLAGFGLGDNVEQINIAAVENARLAATEGTIIAGAVGSLGIEVNHYNESSVKQAQAAFTEQTKVLIDAGVDVLIFETFYNLEELIIAVNSAENKIDVIAQMTVSDDNKTIYGTSLESAAKRLDEIDSVKVIGLNCGFGPLQMLECIDTIRANTDKAISIQPNAGLPQDVGGRSIYMCTAEYMAEYAKRYFEKGVKIIGGCCGTTPDHIREISRAVKSIDRAARSADFVKTVKTESSQAQEKQAKELSQRSLLGNKLVTGEKIYTIEISPPLGADLSKMLEKVELCKDNGIEFINIPDGPRASSRVSAMITAIKIAQDTGIEPILHYCCRDRNLIGMQSDLLGINTVGLHNVLVITGDPPKLGKFPNATAVYDLDSVALTKVISGLNVGIDSGGNEFSPPLELTVGVGANPAATDIEREIERLREKVAAGADYVVTQPVFDTERFFSFIKTMKDFKIPVVAGIWPFTSFKNAEFMANEVPGVVVPKDILKRMSKMNTKQEGIKTGIEIAKEMMAKVEEQVAGFAVSAPFGNVRIALATLNKIGINEVFSD